MDIFVRKEEKEGLWYAITIAELIADNTYESLFTADYRNDFKRGCGCEITAEREGSYAHFKGVLYEMSKVEKGTSLKGYTISTVKRGKLFTITFITTPESFDIYQSEFDQVINTLKIH